MNLEPNFLLTWKIYLISFLIFIAGCSSKPQESVIETNVDFTREAIETLSARASTKSEIATLIELHELLISREPNNKQSLASLAQLYTLCGAAYLESRRAKRKQFKKAMAFAMRHMMLNYEFSTKIREGKKPWEIANTLTAQEADGMGWWATAMLYYYREGLPTPIQILNYRIVERAKAMMDQIEKVDPAWENGTNYFNLSIYYHALPSFAGGDKKLSQSYMAKAEFEGPNRLLMPWGKAKYIYAEQRDVQRLEETVNKILKQDIRQENGESYAWRLYFQTEAKNLVEHK